MKKEATVLECSARVPFHYVVHARDEEEMALFIGYSILRLHFMITYHLPGRSMLEECEA